ncbi:MAG TPA: hypothetical protein VD861_10575, partial [Pyrinomonadaceae bacterium]|nr:hypothetical protein [Pyrinomonadaceae bacterium]
MGNDAREGRERGETDGVSRRKFLESTGYAGGAAIVAAVNSTCAGAQEGKPQPTPTPQGTAAAQQPAAPAL